MAEKNHYNAFISYRHHPEDIRVAAEIGRSLERFRIPKEIRKKAGGITRIFRDKDELPITSNLSDDITQALENSDYLIVICSTHTGESEWVKREISLFLQTHTHDRVLTVLVDGEPYEVIPQILLSREIVDPQTGKTRREPVEPLSCDWRLPRGKARREELPRLVAALLGCGYDELRQRQRHYRTRRMIWAFSAALALSLALASYFLYTSIQIQNANIQIQENLNQALRNQSLHLATAAWERLEAGDRLTAIALALEALPGETGNRPYVPEAEQALTKSLGLYEKDSGITAQGFLDAGSLISSFWVVPDGSTVYVLDQRGLITIWDAGTFQKTGTLTFDNVSEYDVWITGNGDLLVRTDEKLCCYQCSGGLLWEKRLGWFRDVTLYDGGKGLCLLAGEDTEFRLIFLDPGTGDVIRSPILLEMPEEGERPSRFYMDDHPKGMPLTIQYEKTNGSLFGGDGAFYLLDWKTGEAKRIFDEIGTVESAAFTSDGKLTVMMSDGSGRYNGKMYSIYTSSPARRVLLCFDSVSGTKLWESEFVTHIYSGCSEIREIPERKQLLFAGGNIFQLVDGETGEIVSRCEAGSGILCLYSAVSSSRFCAVLQDGSLCVYCFDENKCTAFKPLVANLSAAAVNGNCYALQENASSIIVYCNQGCDPLWIMDRVGYPYIWQRQENLLAVENSENLLSVINLEDNHLLWSHVMDSGRGFLAFSTDGKRLWYCNRNKVESFDTDNGSAEAFTLPIPLEETSAYYVYDDPIFFRNRLYYLVECLGNKIGYCLTAWDTDTRQIQTWNLPASDAWGYEEPEIVGVTEGFAWILTPSGELWEADLAGDTWRIIETGLMEKPVLTTQENGTLAAVVCGDQIVIRTLGGESMAQITLEYSRPVSMCFHDGMLLVLYNDGNFCRYGLAGNSLGITETEATASIYYWTASMAEPNDFTWTFTEDNMLVLGILGYCNLIETETWVRTASFPSYLMYQEDGSLFICGDRDGLYAFPRHDLEEIQTIAASQLGDFRLSREQRYYYGLES